MTPTPIPEEFKEKMWKASTDYSHDLDLEYREKAEFDFEVGAEWAYRLLSDQPRWVKEYEKSPPKNGSYHCKVRIPNEPPYPTIVMGVVDYEDGEWRTGSVDERVIEWLLDESTAPIQ